MGFQAFRRLANYYAEDNSDEATPFPRDALFQVFWVVSVHQLTAGSRVESQQGRSSSLITDGSLIEKNHKLLGAFEFQLL